MSIEHTKQTKASALEDWQLSPWLEDRWERVFECYTRVWIDDKISDAEPWTIDVERHVRSLIRFMANSRDLNDLAIWLVVVDSIRKNPGLEMIMQAIFESYLKGSGYTLEEKGRLSEAWTLENPTVDAFAYQIALKFFPPEYLPYVFQAMAPSAIDTKKRLTAKDSTLLFIHTVPRYISSWRSTITGQ